MCPLRPPRQNGQRLQPFFQAKQLKLRCLKSQNAFTSSRNFFQPFSTRFYCQIRNSIEVAKISEKVQKSCQNSAKNSQMPFVRVSRFVPGLIPATRTRFSNYQFNVNSSVRQLNIYRNSPRIFSSFFSTGIRRQMRGKDVG